MMIDINSGLFKIEIRPRITRMTYCGNMHSSWDSIACEFNHLFGEGADKKLVELASFQEEGYPSYEWLAKVKTSEFKKAFFESSHTMRRLKEKNALTFGRKYL